MRKPVIVQHVFGAKNSGGPVVALERLIEANVGGEFIFHRMDQIAPAGGVNFRLISAFRDELRRIRPDMVHVRGLGNEGFHGALAARLAGVKNVLVSVHGTVRDLRFSSNKVRTAVVRDVLEPITLRLASHLITVCQYAAQRDFLAPYQSKFLGVVHNGVDMPPQEVEAGKQYREMYGVSEGDLVAVCVSRVTKEKGYFLLAEALSSLPALGGVLHVWIVGDGPDRIEIERAIPPRPDVRVSFLGHSNQVGSILSQADFFLFPSLHENLSNALLEAMSYGLPPIAFSVGGNAEVIGAGCGRLISPGDVDGFSRAVFEYVQKVDLMRLEGSMARDRVRGDFSTSKMVSEMYSVYRQVLGVGVGGAL